MVDPHTDPAEVVGHIVNSVGIGAAQFRDEEVMHAHLFGISFGSIGTPAVLEIAY